jgi:hypothetical protein
VRLQVSRGEYTLNSTIVALTAFVLSFGASLVAIVGRSRLPAHHLEGDSKDVLRLVLGLVTTLTALVLSLLISSGYSAYQAQQTEVQQLGVHVFQIDRTLAHFGSDTNEQRNQLRQVLAATIARVWPADGTDSATYAPKFISEEGEELFDAVARMSAKTDLQRLTQSRALQLLEGVGETSHILIAQSKGALSWPMLVALMSWMTVLFFGFGLFSRFNVTVVGALFVGALAVSAAVFLIIEMNHPYGGWIQISSVPLRTVLTQLGR